MQVLGPVVSVVCHDVGPPRMPSEPRPLLTDRIERANPQLWSRELLGVNSASTKHGLRG